MELSKNNRVILFTVKKGYVVNKDGDVFYNGRKRSLNKDHKGYFYFSVRFVENNKVQIKKVYVHKLQAYIKFGNKLFEEGIEVRHLDNDSTNNKWDNIDIGDRSQNELDKPKEDRIKYAINASYENRVFSDDVVKCILNDRRKGFTYKELCDKYNTSKSTLSYMFNKSLYGRVVELVDTLDLKSSGQ